MLPLANSLAESNPEIINDNGFKYMVYSDYAIAVGFDDGNNLFGNIFESLSFSGDIKSYVGKNSVPVTIIGVHTLSQKNIKSINIPKTVKRINGDSSLTSMWGAFSQTDLETVTIPNNVEYIGCKAF